MFERFTDKAIRVIMLAQEEARRLGQNSVGSEQILLGLIEEDTSIAADTLKSLGINLKATRTVVERIIGHSSGFVGVEIPFTPGAKQILEQAVAEAQQLDQDYIAPEHLLLGITQDEGSVAARVLQNLGIDLPQLRTQLLRAIGEMAAVPAGGVPERASANRSTNRALEEFGTDLTRLAAEGKLDPVVGRQVEIERLIQILGRRAKNNPMLVGEPGVGKTAIAEGLAQRIINGDVPELLENKQVISLDMGLLVAGTRLRGEFEERLTQIINEVRQASNIILVIDEIHTLVGAGAVEGGMDAANLLKPALARGELQCIGATTLDEYRQYIEKDAALERRFQPITVNEPTVEETIEILQGVRGRYEQHHRLTISDQALMAAANFSDRYISDRYLPDKAIDLIDEAGSRVRLRYTQPVPDRNLKRELQQITKAKDAAAQSQDFKQASELRDREMVIETQLRTSNHMAETLPEIPLASPVVTADDIAQVVSAWTGVPVNRLTESESMQLLHLEDTLHQRLIGQADAVKAVARAIRRARVGLGSPHRPIASFIFCGPTGVGKTELTKALAASVFGSETAMIRLDMSEYMESQSVSKLIGSPPGYVGYGEGGQLTEAIRRQPYTVVLLDEIEKAHPDVFNLLLQLLEDGRLTNAQGRVVDFKNTLVIMTSNLGAQAIEKGGSGLGFIVTDTDAATAQYNRIRSQVNEALKLYFRPEFLNRLDDIIVFRQLTRNEVKHIADLLLKDVSTRLSEQNIQVEVTAAFKDRLVIEGYDPSYGARPLRRAISRLVEDNLAEAILAGRIQSGDTAVLDIDDDAQVQVLLKRSLALVGAGA
ncbi:MAG: ATP-dependent Clp protease ATP-binding subunit [Cyanothece sp. SIO1E1]|nr:ATP-dependent Clp protease ATP-binding subunit [Cyanothece sp. SIO1E1]